VSKRSKNRGRAKKSIFVGKFVLKNTKLSKVPRKHPHKWPKIDEIDPFRPGNTCKLLTKPLKKWINRWSVFLLIFIDFY
jgi:hypothetical protein